MRYTSVFKISLPAPRFQKVSTYFKPKQACRNIPVMSPGPIQLRSLTWAYKLGGGGLYQRGLISGIQKIVSR